MSERLATLGQVDVAPIDTWVDVYSPGQGKSAVVRLHLTNRGAATVTYRVAVCPGGETAANKHYRAYGATLVANDDITRGPWTLGPGDVLRVRVDVATLTANVDGSEVS